MEEHAATFEKSGNANNSTSLSGKEMTQLASAKVQQASGSHYYTTTNTAAAAANTAAAAAAAATTRSKRHNEEQVLHQESLLATTPSLSGVTLCHNDVLFGKGNGIIYSEGNKNFRRLISAFKSTYLSSPRDKKKAIAEKVFQQIVTLQPPGRFLELRRRPSTHHEKNAAAGKDKKNHQDYDHLGKTRTRIAKQVPQGVFYVEATHARTLEKISQALREKPSPRPARRTKSSQRRNQFSAGLQQQQSEAGAFNPQSCNPDDDLLQQQQEEIKTPSKLHRCSSKESVEQQEEEASAKELLGYFASTITKSEPENSPPQTLSHARGIMDKGAQETEDHHFLFWTSLLSPSSHYQERSIWRRVGGDEPHATAAVKTNTSVSRGVSLEPEQCPTSATASPTTEQGLGDGDDDRKLQKGISATNSMAPLLSWCTRTTTDPVSSTGITHRLLLPRDGDEQLAAFSQSQVKREPSSEDGDLSLLEPPTISLASFLNQHGTTSSPSRSTPTLSSVSLEKQKQHRQVAPWRIDLSFLNSKAATNYCGSSTHQERNRQSSTSDGESKWFPSFTLARDIKPMQTPYLQFAREAATAITVSPASSHKEGARVLRSASPRRLFEPQNQPTICLPQHPHHPAPPPPTSMQQQQQQQQQKAGNQGPNKSYVVSPARVARSSHLYVTTQQQQQQPWRSGFDRSLMLRQQHGEVNEELPLSPGLSWYNKEAVKLSKSNWR